MDNMIIAVVAIPITVQKNLLPRVECLTLRTANQINKSPNMIKATKFKAAPPGR